MFGAITAGFLKLELHDLVKQGCYSRAARFYVVVHRCAMTSCSRRVQGTRRGARCGRSTDEPDGPAARHTPRRVDATRLRGRERAPGHGTPRHADRDQATSRPRTPKQRKRRLRSHVASSGRRRRTGRSAVPSALPSKARVGVTPAVDRRHHRTCRHRRLYLRPFRMARAASYVIALAGF